MSPTWEAAIRPACCILIIGNQQVIRRRKKKMRVLNMKLGMVFLALVLAAPTALTATGSLNQGYGRTDVSRNDLTRRIRKELVTLPYYGVFDNLAFKAEGGTVTHYAQVVRPTTRSDAERRVARLRCV